MKILHDFKYAKPDNLDAVLALLADYGKKARPLAGGTDVVVNMKYRSILQLIDGAGTTSARFEAAKRAAPMDRPEVVISLDKLDELKGIQDQNGRLKIGPLTTMTEFVKAEGIPVGATALTDAAAIMGSPLIRNRGTIGGNLVNARPAADTAVALIALGAQVKLQSKKGQRTVEAGDFIVSPGRTVKEPDELVIGIEIPYGEGSASAYYRQGTRRQLEIALVSSAAWLQIDKGTGKITAARICLGAVGPKPMLSVRAAASLVGQNPDGPAFSKAAQIAKSDATPIDDFRGSAAYRLELVEVLTKRTLETAAARAGS